jgi:hypothetical protein
VHGFPVLEPLARVFNDATVKSLISLINVVLVIKSLCLSEVKGAIKLVSISIGVGSVLKPVFLLTESIHIRNYVAIGVTSIVPVRLLPCCVSPIFALTVHTFSMVNLIFCPVLKLISSWVKWPNIFVLVTSLLFMIVIVGQTARVVAARLHVLELLEGL